MISHTPAATRADWLLSAGSDRDVVISSRIRLARNITSLPFYPRMTADDRITLRKTLEEACSRSSETFFYVDGAAISETLHRYYAERGVLEGDDLDTFAFLTHGGRQIVRSGPVDHLVCDTTRGGFELTDALEEALALDAELEERLDFAVALHHGYLFPDVERVGSGLSASMMVHLPGLDQSGELSEVSRELQREGVGLRTFSGGHASSAALYLAVANAPTGKSESETTTELERYGEALLHYERAARNEIASDYRDDVVEAGYRAFGTLRHARKLQMDEAFTLLSLVRFSITTGEAQGIGLETVDELLYLVQPGHVMALHDPDEQVRLSEEEHRAAFVREIIEEKMTEGE